MQQKLIQLFKSDFVKNIMTMITGNVIAQAITLVSIPILTRLYSPAEFGLIALFISTANVLAVLANGRLDMAIVLPKKSGHAFNLLVSSFTFSIIISVLSLIGIIIFHKTISRFFNASAYTNIIWFLPLCIFLTSTQKVMSYWFTRNREFKKQSTNRILQSASQTGVRLSRDIFTDGHWGLFTGYAAGLLFSWFDFVICIIRKDFWKLKYLSAKTSIKTLKDHINFPLYLMPMGLLNSFAVNLLIFALSFVTTSTMVGHYERAWRVINFPLSFISLSFSSVFFERMGRQSSKKVYIYSYFVNLSIAILLLFPIGIWGEDIFSFILGKDWAIAGRIARLMLPLTIFNFATQSVSSIFSVIKKNEILLVWQVIYLVITIGWLLIAQNFDLFFLLAIFSVLGSVLYISLAIIGYNKLVKFNVSTSNL